MRQLNTYNNVVSAHRAPVAMVLLPMAMPMIVPTFATSQTVRVLQYKEERGTKK